MSKRRLVATLLTVSLALSVGVVATVGGAAPATENGQSDGYPGSRSLGVTVRSDGEPLENVSVTVVNKKTGTKVFTGFTDSAGQVDVTLPQGQYEVIVQGQSKTVTLNRDTNVTFDLASEERPNG